MPTKKATATDKSNSQEPGSKSNCVAGKKMMALLMECDGIKCKALCKVLNEEGFDVFVCNDLSSCVHVLRSDYALGFALIAPTINGRNGYMEMIRVFCNEQRVPLEVIDDNTIRKIRRHGIHFPQQIVP